VISARSNLRRPSGGECDVLHAQAAPTGSAVAIPTPLESRICNLKVAYAELLGRVSN
jgi:hypothetical protein